jgi:SAM-dependent methyltransferase
MFSYIDLSIIFKTGFLIMFNKIGKKVFFKCNICGNRNIANVENLNREEQSCSGCGSNVRLRGIIHFLSLTLFGKSISLNKFPINKNINGIGLSDWLVYANILEQKFKYSNTYFHKKPELDITNVSKNLYNTLDFIISADVFEHIEIPVSRAFQNCYNLLKPGGSLILTVPYTKEGNETVEHFPNLNDYKILQDSLGNFYLENINVQGEKEIFNNLIFHGGPGTTLEMRVFCENSLIAELRTAGFNNIQILNSPFWKFGIYHKENWSLPLLVKK